ncbi:MAG: hypothetical protein ACR2NO_12370 [Chloroflexota bacterium]
MSDTEFARRGDEIYAREVRPRVTPDDGGKFVAIDVDTGAFEIDADARAAMDRLAARRPGVEAWLARVGRGYAHRFGRRSGRGNRRA